MSASVPPDAGLARLVRLLAPPPEPSEVPKESDWADAESVLGRPLPPDYKRFVEIYGSGSIGEFLEIRNPASQNEFVRLTDAHEAQMAILRQVRQQLPAEVPYPLHPEAGGLILWAESSNGDCCYWLADPLDRPERWPVVVGEARGPRWDRYNRTMTTFLADLIEGTIVVPMLPAELFQGWRWS